MTLRTEMNRALTPGWSHVAKLLVVPVLLFVSYVLATRGTQPRAHASPSGKDASPAASLRTRTPIKHLVVIVQENASFDHYFATYPRAANPPGEPQFQEARNTPGVRGLDRRLLTKNPNLHLPFRLDRSEALTCDMNHDYQAEQRAYDHGLTDKFVQSTEGKRKYAVEYCPRGIVMGYYDGNTVTALWNYAQHFAMSDNVHATTFGPSTPGALNLVAGDTAGILCAAYYPKYAIPTCSSRVPPTSLPHTHVGDAAIYFDIDPYYDDCSTGGPHNRSRTAALATRNIGDLLDASGISWGWFAAGFDDCRVAHPDSEYDQQVAHINPTADKRTTLDYAQFEEPFQYFSSTSNPHHLPPKSVKTIGRSDQANHQYDLTDFWRAVDAGRMPAVSYLKAPGYQTGHPRESDPLDEQSFLVSTVNRIERSSAWPDTAIIIVYDDSDGWYDHNRGRIVNHSATPLDFGCGPTSDGAPLRCGYGPRVPFLLLSPYARRNFVGHSLLDQTSTLRFIEDNWLNGERLGTQSFDVRAGSIAGMFDFRSGRSRTSPLFLDPATGEAG
jgi:phospholipase C